MQNAALVNRTSSSRPALRLVPTVDLSRQDWLDVRKSGLGSSDAASAVGLNPYKSQLELWLEKTGQGAGLPALDVQDDTHPTYWGTLLEPIVAAAYTKRTGLRVRRVNAVLQHPQHPWMLANVDRAVVGSDEVQLLECKTCGLNGAKLWREGVPEYVQLQVQHQLAVTGKRAADVAVLVCGNELRVHRIERDDELIARLIELEAQFWRLVETRTEPPADGSESAGHALQALYPQDSGATVDLRSDAQLSQAFAQLLTARNELTQAQEREALLKQRIQQAMGEATRALFDAGEVSWKRSRDASVVDVARLQKERPDWAAPYFTTKPGSRRFTVQS